jgi:hypothetical protein
MPRSPSAIETLKNRLSRDFWRDSIFDFCNKISQGRTVISSLHHWRHQTFATALAMVSASRALRWLAAWVYRLVKVLSVGHGQDKTPRGIDDLKDIIDLHDLPRALEPIQLVHQLRPPKTLRSRGSSFLSRSRCSQSPSILVCILSRRASAEAVEIPPVEGSGFPYAAFRLEYACARSPFGRLRYPWGTFMTRWIVRTSPSALRSSRS